MDEDANDCPEKLGGVDFKLWFRDKNDEDCCEIADAVGFYSDCSSFSSFSVGQWNMLGSFLSHCTNLKEICLNYVVFTKEIISALFQSDGSYNFPLERFNIECSEGIGAIGMAAFLPFLKTRKELKYLDLGVCNLGNEGAKILAEVLDHVRIEELDIRHNKISDAGVSSILASKHSKNLVKLAIEGNRISHQGIEEIASFSRRYDIALQTIHIGDDAENSDYDSDDDIDDSEFFHFDAESIYVLIRSLSTNTTMKKIDICSDVIFSNDDDRDRLADTVMELVCNTSSLEALRQSNHVLGEVVASCCSFFPDRMEKSLRINAREDISNDMKIRSKLRSFFFRGDFDMYPFLSMKPAWIPKVLELMARSEECIGANHWDSGCRRFVITLDGNLNGMYNFLRRWNVHTLFNFRSSQFEIKELKEKLTMMAKTQLESDQKILQLESEVRNLKVANRLLTEEKMLLQKEDKNCGYSRKRLRSESD
ncbi:hypothetical protein ACHAXS_004714 [Conticribra weissflogii]